MGMLIGVDSYSYHRCFGDLRPGEVPRPGPRWPLSPEPVLAHAAELGVECVFLETCFLPSPDDLDPGELRGKVEQVGFSWGHPWPSGSEHGLNAGRGSTGETDLYRWVELAASLGHPVMRITAGSPATRQGEPGDRLLNRLAPVLRRVCDRVASSGVRLAVENHGDLTAVELLALLRLVDSPVLGVCLDNVNMSRVGDDMVTSSELLARYATVVQLKDCLAGNPTVPGGPLSAALGEGIAPLDRVVRALATAGYAGPVCIEIASLAPGSPDELDLVSRSVGWLKAHLMPQ